MFAEEIRVAAQHRFDARFFIVSRDEQQQAGGGHGQRMGKIPPERNRLVRLLEFKLQPAGKRWNPLKRELQPGTGKLRQPAGRKAGATLLPL